MTGWLFVAFLLAVFFLFVEVLILAFAINNLHYALYFSVAGILGFICMHQAWKIIKNTTGGYMSYKLGSYAVLGILIIGCIALLANIVILVMKKI